MTGPGLSSPAALRNREPILAVLRQELPRQGLVLELASGSGEHAVHFAAALPDLLFQPSDPDERARASILAHAQAAGLANILPPLCLDASDPEGWPTPAADALLAINLTHISPWAATQGLLAGAGQLLAAGAPLIVYGPFRQADIPLAPTNAAFDSDLRARNPEWGLRRLEDLDALACLHGLRRTALYPMPANNLMLVWRRERPAADGR